MIKPHIPDILPLKDIDWERHATLIGKANAALARYDGILQGMVNPQVLLSPLTTREAVLSSRIEGTQASLEEVLQYEADVGDPEKNLDLPDSPQVRDIHEIINYRKAMGTAVEKMAGRPFGINTISRELHRILLTGVRGRYKDPGEIRRIQNYIASPGTPIDQATFIPPSPEVIMDALARQEEENSRKAMTIFQGFCEDIQDSSKNCSKNCARTQREWIFKCNTRRPWPDFCNIHVHRVDQYH